jgi:hypothetical protein
MITKRIFTWVALTLACGTSLSDSAAGAVVMDQIGDVNAYDLAAPPTPSQIFTDSPSWDCMVIDDFTVDASELRITHVAGLLWAQAGFNSFQDVVAYQLSVFSSPANAATDLPGDVASLIVIAGSGASVAQVNGGDYGLVSLNVNLSLLSAGTYWVGISPLAADSIAGRFYVQNSGAQGLIMPGNQDGQFANPDDGLGYGVLKLMKVDYAYAVTAVPEPAAITLCILGGCGWLCRRQRVHPATDKSGDRKKSF